MTQQTIELHELIEALMAGDKYDGWFKMNPEEPTILHFDGDLDLAKVVDYLNDKLAEKHAVG